MRDGHNGSHLSNPIKESAKTTATESPPFQFHISASPQGSPDTPSDCGVAFIRAKQRLVGQSQEVSAGNEEQGTKKKKKNDSLSQTRFFGACPFSKKGRAHSRNFPIYATS